MTGARLMRRLADLNRLFAAIQRATDDGDLVPCTVDDRAYLWLSEHPEEQQAAVHGCASCPALEACWRYVSAHPEPSGVWAGSLPGRKRKPVTP